MYKIPLVTVSMPYFRTPETIRRAVDAVLNQTMRDLRLVVICDGSRLGDELADIADERLIVFSLPENRGRYFADAVTLELCGSPWFAVHDADDEADPRWLERMLAAASSPDARGRDYVSTAQRVQARDGSFSIEKVKPPVTRPTLTHYAHMAGLWRTEWLRDTLGGFHPAYRVGYDTLLSQLARMHGAGVDLSEPLYTRYHRAGSLTTDRATGMRSAFRRDQRTKLAELLTKMRSLNPASKPADHIRAEASGLRDEVFAHADRLAARIREGELAGVEPVGAMKWSGSGLTREQALADNEARPELGALRLATMQSDFAITPEMRRITRDTPPGPTEGATFAGEPIFDEVVPDPLPRTRAHALDLVVDEGRWARPWAIGRAVAAELDRYLAAHAPSTIVEFGSGASTLVLARHAVRTGARLQVLEHSAAYARRTRDELKADRMAHLVDVTVAPLVIGHELGPRYDAELLDQIDFALIDGPPEGSGGRGQVVAQLADRLRPQGEAWLDDASRDGEKRAIEAWRAGGGTASVSTWGGRSVARLRVGTAPGAIWIQPRADDVVVTILAGGRPDLLSRQLASGIPWLGAEVVAVLNSHDGRSAGALTALGIPFEVPEEGRLHTAIIGAGVAHCAHLAIQSGKRYWLHLEDDWEMSTADGSWLSRAIEALDVRKEIKQVRLRHVGERVLPYNMITRRTLSWRADHELGIATDEAHWTFNPSLVRTSEVAPIFARELITASAERRAQEIFKGDVVAQLYPGAFHHIGEGHRSLAARIGGR